MIRRYLKGFSIIEVDEDVTDEELEIEKKMVDRFILNYFTLYNKLVEVDDYIYALVIAYLALDKANNIKNVSYPSISKSFGDNMPEDVMSGMKSYFPKMFMRRLAVCL